jgi:hypothetical protein
MNTHLHEILDIVVYGKPQVKECPLTLNFTHHKALQASGEAMAPPPFDF